MDIIEEDTPILLQKTENKDILKYLRDYEHQKFGDRCPDNFEKLGMMGRGLNSIVWLACDLETGDNVALK